MAIILVEVLPEVGGLVATLTEIGGKRALLMVGVPVGRGTIVVVCEHLEIVNMVSCNPSNVHIIQDVQRMRINRWD